MNIQKYYQERNSLFAGLERERQQLLAAGISEADIFRAHIEDYKAWKADRVYVIHNSVSADELGEEALALLRERSGRTSSNEPEIGGLLHNIEDPGLLAVLRSLSAADLKMVEACYVNGISQEEYADSIGRTQSYVSKHLRCFQNRFKAPVEENS
jgi:DNA-binding CsgD family transcriptional regulator